MFSALTSFLGGSVFRMIWGETDNLRFHAELNARQVDVQGEVAGANASAAEEPGKWIRGGGEVLPGLVSRRAAECVLL